MKRIISSLAVLLFAAAALGQQGPSPGVIFGNPTPGGACLAGAGQIVSSTGTIYTCVSSVWTSTGTASFPGCTSDGSNGFQCTGALSAGTAVSAPQVTITNAPIGSEVLANGAGYTTATPFYTQPGLTLYGDSICLGVGPGFTNQQIGPLLNNLFGAPFTNRCVSGAQAADIARLQVFPNTTALQSGSPNFILEGGTNDGNICGSSAGCQGNFQLAEQASLSNLIIPYTNKVWGYQASVTGTTLLDTTIAGVNGIASFTNGSTFTFVTPFAGTAVDVVWHGNDAWAGTATVTIDGSLVDTLNSSGTAQTGHVILTTNGTSDTPWGKQYTGLANTTHTVLFTITSATNASNEFSVLYVATPYVTTQIANPPVGAVNGVFASHLVPGGTLATYNTLAKNIETTYQNEGLQVSFIDVRAFMNTTTDFDTVPNNITGQVITVATTNGSPTVTVTGASIGANMAGWPIEILLGGAASATLDAEVLSVSGSTITLNTNALATNASTTAWLGPPGTVCGPGFSGLHPSNCGSIHYMQAVLSTMRPRTASAINNPAFTGTATAVTLSPILLSTTANNSTVIDTSASFPGTGTARALMKMGLSTSAPTFPSSAGVQIGYNRSAGTDANTDFLNEFSNGGTATFRVDMSGNVTGNTFTTPNSYTSTVTNGTSVNLTGYPGTGTQRPYLCFCYSGATAPSWIASPLIGVNLGNFDSGSNIMEVYSGGGSNLFKIDAGGKLTAGALNTIANCSNSASPAVCAAAPSGSVVVAAAATTVVVNTTAVTANSQILVQEDSSLGTKLSVTCNTTPATAPPTISARTAATSFTITTTAPAANPRCFSYMIVN